MSLTTNLKIRPQRFQLRVELPELVVVARWVSEGRGDEVLRAIVGSELDVGFVVPCFFGLDEAFGEGFLVFEAGRHDGGCEWNGGDVLHSEKLNALFMYVVRLFSVRHSAAAPLDFSCETG